MRLQTCDMWQGKVRRIGVLTVAVGVVFGGGSAKADPPDAPNDFGIVLADPTIDPPPLLPRNPLEANATFDRRAVRFLRFAACRPENPTPAAGAFGGVFKSEFSHNLD